MLNESTVLQALHPIQDPDLDQSIVDLGLVKDLKIEQGRVSFLIELTTPSSPAREELRQAAAKSVLAIAGTVEIEIRMGFKVTSKPRATKGDLIPLVKNAVAVASGKGGVGKSTVAANLATALSGFGARVGLMDADVYGPSIPILMGASEAPKVTTANRIIPPEMHGVKLISMGYFLPRNDAVIWRGPMLHKMVQDFLGIVEWGELDYLVIDLPPGTGDVQLSLCQTIPLTGAVVVSTPQDLALEVASKAIAMFQKLNTPILGIVENMSYHICSHCGEREDIFGHGGARQASQQLGYPFLGEIPLQISIRKRSDHGLPMALESASLSGHAFLTIARAVATQVSLANFRERPAVIIEE